MYLISCKSMQQGVTMKKIEFGMPTLIELDKLYDCIQLCKELGLDFIELNMNLPQYQLEKLNTEELKQLMLLNNIYFTIHLDENLNVCDMNNKVAKAYMDTALAAIEIAKELQMPVLNMHMANGVYFTLPDKKIYLFSKYKEEYLTKLKTFRVSCEKAIGDSNVKICIENCDGFQEFSKHGIELLLKSDVFALTLDIGHNHSSGKVDEAFINKHIERLYHMHIHDASEDKNHLVLGTGEIDINQKLVLAQKHNCRCVLETKTVKGLAKSVEFIRKE